jgi:hypothetical protein
MPDDLPEFGGRDLLGVGGLLVACVVGCTALGLLVDHLTGWSPGGALAGVALGIVLGVTGSIVRVRRSLRPDRPAAKE